MQNYRAIRSSTGAVRAVSEQAPLLYFWHAEDHGWGYTVLHEGEVQATLEVSYELLYNGAVAVFEEAYPGEDTLDEEGNPRPEFEVLTAEYGGAPGKQVEAFIPLLGIEEISWLQ